MALLPNPNPNPNPDPSPNPDPRSWWLSSDSDPAVPHDAFGGGSPSFAHGGASRTGVHLQLRRAGMLASCEHQLLGLLHMQRHEGAPIPLGAFSATFEGEPGAGAGVTREFWACVGAALLEEGAGLFEARDLTLTLTLTLCQPCWRRGQGSSGCTTRCASF